MIKDEIIRNNKPVYLSAQRYAKLTDKEKKEMRDILIKEGLDEYEENMRKLWPKVVSHPRAWRK